MTRVATAPRKNVKAETPTSHIDITKPMSEAERNEIANTPFRTTKGLLYDLGMMASEDSRTRNGQMNVILQRAIDAWKRDRE